MGLFESGRSAGTLFVALSFQIIRFYGAMGLIVTVGLPVVVLGFLVWVLSSAQIMFLDDGTFLANRFREQGAVHVVLGSYMGLWLCLLLEPHVGALPHRRHWGRR